MDAAAPKQAQRRPSIDKAPIAVDLDLDLAEPPFDRLPDEIIEQILEAADPNGFSSLVLLNSKWRAVSQRSHLYRQQLARCPAFAANPSALPSAHDKNLPRLRRLLSHEAKRNLFEAYTRPKRTLVKLVSSSFSSAACIGGESLSFSTSLRGHHILAYNSSRIYVLDARGPTLKVRRELKILRRPTSVCIADDASLLAVFSAEMRVDIYDLKACPPRRDQSITLDSNPRTIALSSCGSVLAAAYEAGIEVMALGTGALPSEKRSVKCDSVDALTFSFDGTQILGMTHQSTPPSTVVITAPYYDPGALMSDGSLSAMWTTSILFPNLSRDCSHAVLLQDGHVEADWAFAYDRSFETFRAVRIDDLRNGTTYFTGPVPNSQAQLLPSTLPSATYHGELVSAAFHGSDIWLYGVPEDPAAVPEREPPNDGSSSLTRGNSARSTSRPSSTWTQDATAIAAAASSTGRAPQWQMVCDRFRNHFVAGHKISELSDVTNVKWVASFGGNSSTLRERLVVTARGITGPRLAADEEDFDYVDGGRVLLLDFDYGLENGTRTEITIELGANDAEILEEEWRDIETEVAIARQRTVLQRLGGGAVGTGPSGGRSLLSVVTSAQGLAAAAAAGARLDEEDENDHGSNDDDDPLAPRIIGRHPASAHPCGESSQETSRAFFAAESLDAPYAHSSPRSGTTLRRAATAAAANRRYNPRAADGTPYEYRRADGRNEHPHESDADNWVPPPPPYQADDPGDAPAFLRAPAISVPPMTTPQDSVALPFVAPAQQHLAPPIVQAPNSAAASPAPSPSPLSTVANSAPARGKVSPSADGGERNKSTALRGTRPSPGPGVSPLESPESIRHGPPHVTPSPMPLAAPPAAPLESLQVPSDLIPITDDLGFSASIFAEFNTLTGTAGATSNLLTLPRPEMRASSTIPVGDSSSAKSEPPPRRLSNAMTWPSAARSPSPTQNQHHTIEQPLIISTPAGVSGALDPPERRASRRGELPILAPVPQRPRASGPNSAPRSAVDRLETIFTDRPAAAVEEDERPAAAAKGASKLLPSWMVKKVATGTPRRSASLVNRRPSRAGRSAAKNMQDARKRGWQSGRGKKDKKGNGDEDGGGTGGGYLSDGDVLMVRMAGGLDGWGNEWTDVPGTPSAEKPLKDRDRDKDKKCVVM